MTLGFGLSVVTSFVGRCPSTLAVAPFPHPAIEPDVRISRIRLSYRTSRLHPRRATAKLCETSLHRDCCADRQLPRGHRSHTRYPAAGLLFAAQSGDRSFICFSFSSSNSSCSFGVSCGNRNASCRRMPHGDVPAGYATFPYAESCTFIG